jgi:Response regulators consisting of a CheY-like receiver domain and a winged-helix DNA-binding domain
VELNQILLVGKYKIDTNSRLISKESIFLKLTEREINLLIYLKNSKEEKTSLDLQKNVWKHSNDLETHTVETHIYRLRKKIFDSFGDNEFIINNKSGYKILE